MPVLAVGGIALVALAAALIALLLVMALRQFVTWIANVFPSFHIPGLGSIQGYIVGAINGAIGKVGKAAEGSLLFMFNILNDPIVFFTHFLNIIHSTFAEVVASLTWIKNTAIPTAVRGLTAAYTNADAVVHNYATALAGDIERDLRAGDAAVTAFVVAMVGDVEADARTLYADAIGYTNAIKAGIENDITASAATVHNFAAAIAGDVETDARNLFSQSVAFTTNAVAAVDAKATALFNQAERDAISAANTATSTAIRAIESEVTHDITPIWNATAQAVAGAISTAGTDFSDAIGYIKSLDLSKPLDLAGTLAATLAIATTLTKLADDCIMPQCRNLSQVGRDLQALFGIVEDGLLFAFLAELIKDPAAGIALVEDTLGTVAHDAVSIGRAMVGV